MSKKKILYYTDCPFFAGCENMIANFFNSEELSKEFDILLVYRYSERYEEGAMKRMDMSKSVPVNLLVEPSKATIVTSKSRLIAILQTIIRDALVFITKYYSILINCHKLIVIFREQAPDILHINNGGYPAATSCYAAILAARKCGIEKIVYVVNNMAADYKHPLRWFDRGLDKIVKQHVSYFVNGSNNAGQRLIDVLSIPSSKQMTIRNGVVPRKVTNNRKDFRTQYGIGEDAFIFAEVANLEERKGHFVLLRAVELFLEQNEQRNIVVLIEGDGPLKDNISSYINEHNLTQCVKMIEVDQIYNLYNAVDVLILPSLYNEDFPNTIIEAMGQGLPVIGTSIAGIPEQIEDHITGLLIPPGSPKALAEAMIELVSDRNFYKFCSCNSKNKFAQNYTAKISVDNYIKLYSSLLKINNDEGANS